MAVLKKNLTKWLVSFQSQDPADLILVAGLLYFIPWLFSYAWRVIQTPYPLEYREGASLLMTDFFLRGKNPFTLANHPLLNNIYGFLYNLVVLPFTYWFGNTFFVHRIISILFILLSCALIIQALTKNKLSLPLALSGASFVLGCMLYGSHPGARSESFGQFLFLFAILFPWLRQFDRVSLIFSGLIGVLAFFAKPYYLLSLGIVAGYLFLFVSKKKGLIYLGVSFGLLFILAYLVNLWFECYFLDVILGNIFQSNLEAKYIWLQLGIFIIAFFPCFVILFSRGVLGLIKRQPEGKKAFTTKQLNFLNLEQPVWLGTADYFNFIFICTLLAIILILGSHKGTYMTYYYQLLTPALVLIVFRKPDLHQSPAINALLFLVNLSLICFWVLYPNQLTTTQQENWNKVSQAVATSKKILNSPLLVGEMLTYGELPVDSGQTEYFYVNRPYPETMWAPAYSRIEQRGQEYLQEISTSLQNREYDRVIITQNYSPFVVDHQILNQNYQLIETIPLAVPQTNQTWVTEIWEPKK